MQLPKTLQLSKTWGTKKEELRRHVDLYRGKVDLANENLAVPVDIGTTEQHRVASKVLAEAKGAVGKVVKQIVNSKTVSTWTGPSTKSLTGSSRPSFVCGTNSRSRPWRKEGGKLYLYRNDLAKFSRAPRRPRSASGS